MQNAECKMQNAKCKMICKISFSALKINAQSKKRVIARALAPVAISNERFSKELQ